MCKGCVTVSHRSVVLAVSAVIVVMAIVVALFVGPPFEGPNGENPNSGPDIFDPSLPEGTLEFTYSPLPTDRIMYIIPLGNLNPPGHTTPTDHIYFVYDGTELEVTVPVSGRVLRIEDFGDDQGITIGVTSTFSYYFFHVRLDEGVNVGDWLEAGQRLGTTAPPSAFDLGVLNKDLANPFANTTRYPDDKLHADAPLKYFKEPIRSTLYAKVARDSEDKDGVFCYDQPGRLIGNWWLTTAPDDLLAAEDYESYALAFVYSNFEPNRIMISIGRRVGGAEGLPYGAYAAVGPAPENVTPESGNVTYILYEYVQGQSPVLGERVGLLIVEMLNDHTIRVQTFADTTSTTREFTQDAVTYIR